MYSLYTFLNINIKNIKYFQYKIIIKPDYFSAARAAYFFRSFT